LAPAGTRRGVVDNAARIGYVNGVTGEFETIGVSQTLRDILYQADINPITFVPGIGITNFGNKTVTATTTALDRINVRRLMIYLKREISRIAATLLFDQNVEVTWSRFLGQVNPFLSSVKSRLGLTDFRVILDSTTTTPDLVDRNILYAKVFLKPARAIEFIAIDFTITDSGASFVD
jgi:phage tail sheath protein FI